MEQIKNKKTYDDRREWYRQYYKNKVLTHVKWTKVEVCKYCNKPVKLYNKARHESTIHHKYNVLRFKGSMKPEEEEQHTNP